MNKVRNKTGGRKAGTPNKATGPIKNLVTDFVRANWSTVEKDFRSPKLSPRDRLMFLEKILKFVIPVQTSANGKIDIRKELDTLSDEALDKVVDLVLQRGMHEAEED